MNEKLAKHLRGFTGQWVNSIVTYDTDRDGNQYVKSSYIKPTTSHAEWYPPEFGDIMCERWPARLESIMR